MKDSVLIRQSSSVDNQTVMDKINERKDYGIDRNKNKYIYTQPEFRHPMKIARTLKLNTTSEDDDIFQYDEYDGNNLKFNGNTILMQDIDEPLRLKKFFSQKSKGKFGRKTSISHIGSAFRDLQQTVKPRRSKKRKTNEFLSNDYNEQQNSKQSFSKTVSRSASLPNIKNDKNTDWRRNNGKKNVIIHKLSNRLNQRQNKSTPILDFESSNIISFPTHRLETYKTKSHDHI